MTRRYYSSRNAPPLQGEVEMAMRERPARKPIGSRWLYKSAAANYSWDEVGPCEIVAHTNTDMQRFGRYIVRCDGDNRMTYYATDGSLTPLAASDQGER